MAAMACGPLMTPELANAANPVAKARTPYGQPATPIQHLVVIFQENISFDHYFGTYPYATNPHGRAALRSRCRTRRGQRPERRAADQQSEPESGQRHGRRQSVPPDRSQAATADQDHDYTPEQLAFDSGLMDLFPVYTGAPDRRPALPPQQVPTNGLIMGYYDGNTVTALWNYAQHYAMSDNSYGTNFGPSTRARST